MGSAHDLEIRSARFLDYWGSDRRTTPRGSQLTGKITWLQLDLGNDDHDHFVDPEEQLRIAISRQLQNSLWSLGCPTTGPCARPVGIRTQYSGAQRWAPPFSVLRIVCSAGASATTPGDGLQHRDAALKSLAW